MQILNHLSSSSISYPTASRKRVTLEFIRGRQETHCLLNRKLFRRILTLSLYMFSVSKKPFIHYSARVFNIEKICHASYPSELRHASN